MKSNAFSHLYKHTKLDEMLEKMIVWNQNEGKDEGEEEEIEEELEEELEEERAVAVWKERAMRRSASKTTGPPGHPIQSRIEQNPLFHRMSNVSTSGSPSYKPAMSLRLPYTPHCKFGYQPLPQHEA